VKLRVVVGEGPLRAPDGEAGLNGLYASAGLTIAGDSTVRRFASAGSEEFFLIGRAIGERTATGTMRTFRDRGEELETAYRRAIEGRIDELEGRFAAVLVRSDGSCEVAADRYGRFDLYYQRVEGQLVVGTDLDLLPVSRGSSGYDQAALVHVLCVFGWRPPKQHTLYQDVKRLGVGQRLRISGGGFDVLQDPFVPQPIREYGPRELDEYAELLIDAVRVRGSEKGNVVYLSSGWDSTAILACLVKVFGAGKVRGVIGRMRYSERSGVINQFEIDRAQAMAAYYGIQLDMVEFDHRSTAPDLFEELRPVLRAHHIGSISALNHWNLANHVAKTGNGNEAVFAGEISDGVHNLGFSQYATIFHPSYSFREYSDKMGSYLFGPDFFGRFLTGDIQDDAVYGLLRGRCGSAHFDDLAPEGAARATQMLGSLFLRPNRVPLWSLDNCRLLTAGGRSLYAEEMEGTYLKHAGEQVTPETLYSWYLHLYNSFHWQGSTVATIPLTGELNGIEVQMPFWDSRLQDFLASMPESWGRGLDLNPTKYPLKWTLANRLDYPMHLQTGPHAYLYDIDPEFNLGVETIYASAFAPYLKDRLRTREYRSLLSPDVFDLDYVESLVKGFLDGPEPEGAEFGDLASLCWLFAAGTYGS
jgi:hypothetical protein